MKVKELVKLLSEPFVDQEAAVVFEGPNCVVYDVRTVEPEADGVFLSGEEADE